MMPAEKCTLLFQTDPLPENNERYEAVYHLATPASALNAALRRNIRSMKLDKQRLQSLPKVLLHEHLDGVLRPQTIIELAKEVNYLELPNGNPEELAQWFHQG